MFNKNDQGFLIRKLARNQVILFLGAGFSSEAQNLLGVPFPTGKSLAKTIWSYLQMPGEYDGSHLKEMFEVLLTSNRPKKEIESLLNEHLTAHPDGVPDCYDIISSVFWRRIYTINIDNLLPLIYDRTRIARLDIIVNPKDDPKERDQFLQSIQVIYLHGKLPCSSDDLIFSRGQYVRSSLDHIPLYEQFIREYSTFCTIFVGTSFDEDLAWQYIEKRKGRPRRISEHRPKSFLIDPKITPTQNRLLKQFNISPICASINDFLGWLSNNRHEFPSRDSLIKKNFPLLPSLSRRSSSSRYSSEIRDFSVAFESVPTDDTGSTQRSLFLLGASPSWNDLHSGLDAPRSITTSLFEGVIEGISESGTFSLLALLGSGGSGKSTILRRLGIDLVRAGRTVFFTDAKELPRPGAIANALIAFDASSILLFDNADVTLRELPYLVNELDQVRKPLVVVVAARTNDYDRMAGKFHESVDIKEYLVPHQLDGEEIVNIIDILEDHGKLGKLKGMKPAKRIREFEDRARKQILVAMREATAGKGFDVIIEDEFERIEPYEAKLLCLCSALATASGYDLKMEEFVGCSHATPAESLHFLRRNLNGILVLSGKDRSLVAVRHQRIADHYVRKCGGTTMLREAHIRLLNVLAPCINKSHWRSRVFEMYKNLISHSNIYVRFYQNIGEARIIYDTLSHIFDNNYHFWLQYGCLELEAGHLDLADNYLQQAKSLRQSDRYVINALGDLELRKAIVANSLQMSLYHRMEGERILISQIEDIGNTNPHCYHILCLQIYNWVKTWISIDAKKKHELSILRNRIKEAVLNHPRNRRLSTLRDVIERAYLNLSIPIENRPQDPSYVEEWFSPSQQ